MQHCTTSKNTQDTKQLGSQVARTTWAVAAVEPGGGGAQPHSLVHVKGDEHSVNGLPQV
jgi:hypothetical protein